MITAKQYGLGAFVTWRGDIDRRMKKTRRGLAKFRKDLGATTRAVGSKTMSMTRSIGGMGKGLQGTFMMGAGSAMMLVPYKLISSAAMESEDNLARVKTLLVTTMDFSEADRSLGLLRDRIFEIGHDSRISLGDLEKASYDLISADLSLAEAMGALKPTADLAVAGQGSMQESVETMTTLLNTYGKRWGDTLGPQEKAIRIGNTLAGTIAAYKTTLPAISGALVYVGGTANALGVELTELTATLGALQTAGLKETIAGTALNAFYRQATKLVSRNGEVTDGATLSTEEYIDALDRGATVQTKATLAGLKLVDARGNVLPFYEILGQLEKRFGITSEKMGALAEQGVKGADALEQLGIPAEYLGLLMERGKGFSSEGSQAISVLLGQSEALKERITLIRESANLDRMLAAQQESLASRLLITKNRMKEFQITVGDANLAQQKEALEFFDGLLESVTGLAAERPGFMRASSNFLLIAGAATGLGVVIRGLRWAGGPLFGIARGLGAIAGKHPALMLLTATLLELKAALDLGELKTEAEAGSEIAFKQLVTAQRQRAHWRTLDRNIGTFISDAVRDIGSLLMSDTEGKWDVLWNDLQASLGTGLANIQRNLYINRLWGGEPSRLGLPEYGDIPFVGVSQIELPARARETSVERAMDMFMSGLTGSTVHHHNEQIAIENRFEVTKDVDPEELRRMVDESQEEMMRVAETRRN